MAALKEHVTLAEALEIEAVKCAAGDARHEYQEWYPKYAELQRKRGAQVSAEVDDLDPAVVAEELAMTRQAISETEDMLAAHRLALVERRQSPYSDADVAGMHDVLASLRANIPALEDAASPPRGAPLDSTAATEGMGA